MTSKTQQVVDYLSARCHYADLNKLLFLVDWKSCMAQGRPLTDLGWRRDDNRLPTSLKAPPAATPRTMLQHVFGRPRAAYSLLTRDDKASLEAILRLVNGMTNAQLITFVLSTFPCMNGHTGDLNLPVIASSYKTILAADANRIAA